MTEVDKVLHHAWACWQNGVRVALATVVYVDGSSYRKPGARMLVTETGGVTGAVSGGCVERAVAARAKRVIADQQPDMLVYDGRHRLGCNGSLHILIEPFAPGDPAAFFRAYQNARGETMRGAFEIHVSAHVPPAQAEETTPRPSAMGSSFDFGGDRFAGRPSLGTEAREDGLFQHRDRVNPGPQLYVIGTEYDAVVLAQLAASQGFGTTLISHPRNPLQAMDGISVVPLAPEEVLTTLQLDDQTAVVLMSHNFARDLAYLRQLVRAEEVAYLGLLGPKRRHDELLNELADEEVEFPDWIHSNVYGPAGIDLRGELPQQIALSIMAEIVGVFHGVQVSSLRDKKGTIHGPAVA